MKVTASQPAAQLRPPRAGHTASCPQAALLPELEAIYRSSRCDRGTELAPSGSEAESPGRAGVIEVSPLGHSSSWKLSRTLLADAPDAEPGDPSSKSDSVKKRPKKEKTKSKIVEFAPEAEVENGDDLDADGEFSQRKQWEEGRSMSVAS
eukprot:365130-Chlamydomonas_euryale.AAC.11